MEAQANDRALRALMCPKGSVIPIVRDCRQAINPYLEKIIDAAHQEGTLRADCTVEDILHLQVALVGIMDADPDAGPEPYLRHMRLFLQGIRTVPQSQSDDAE